MAYQAPNLSALAYANGFTLWHCRTSDRVAELIRPGYFGPHAMPRDGDIILASTGIGTEPGTCIIIMSMMADVLTAVPLGAVLPAFVAGATAPA